MYTKIRSPIVQYLIGMLINILYVAFLISNQTSYQNIQLPENNYAENLWKGKDVLSYTRPAQNFITYWVFGSGTIPDYRRTIGYPLFLAALMMLFNNYWLLFTFFLQAVIFALMYPLLSMIAKILFNANNRVISFSFFFFILAGTYIVRVPMVMTDAFFTILFTLGLYLGLESIIRRSSLFLLIHIIFIAYAAQVRPVLSLYPLINCLILLSIAEKYNLTRCLKTYLMIGTAFIFLLVLCNLPSIRNYIHYGFPKPTDLLAVNMFDYLGRDVLIDVGRSGEYEEIRKNLQEIKDPNARTRLQEQSAIKIFKESPLITVKRIVHNAIGILGRTHWPEMAHFWGYSFADNFSPEHMPLKKSKAIYLIEVFFNIVYLLVYALFLGFLIRMFRSENVVFSLAVVFVVTYFLIPTFLVSGAGARLRLPVEGLIVIMAACEIEYRFKALKGKLYRLLNSIYLATGVNPYSSMQAKLGSELHMIAETVISRK